MDTSLRKKIAFEVLEGETLVFSERPEKAIVVRIACSCGKHTHGRDKKRKCFSRSIIIFPNVWATEEAKEKDKRDMSFYGKFTFPGSGGSLEINGGCQSCGSGLKAYIAYCPLLSSI